MDFEDKGGLNSINNYDLLTEFSTRISLFWPPDDKTGYG